MNKILINALIAFVVLVITACGGGGGGGTKEPVSNPAKYPPAEPTLSPTQNPSEEPLPTQSLRDPDNDDSQNDIQVWKPDSAYADVLKDCVLAQADTEYCTLDTLPLLGMEFAEVSTESIMSRVLTSHEWMALRFKKLLQAYPPEMLPLFRGLTAIVIDDDIRPAHYKRQTGAIYVDPDFLWQSLEEKHTINPKEDFREDYAESLSLRVAWRMLKNGKPAFYKGSLDNEKIRNFNDVLIMSSRLFLHELAHVNDFLPYERFYTLDRNNTVYQAIKSHHTPSDQLTQEQPLTSQVLFELAKVLYGGATPSLSQRVFTPSNAGEAFESDSAAHMYAYASQYEDLAMLFEIAMMKYFWQVDYQMAFILPVVDKSQCKDYRISWSATDWIGDEDVKARAMFVTNELVPHIDLSLFYQDLAAPSLISSGDWCLQSSEVAGFSPASMQIMSK